MCHKYTVHTWIWRIFWLKSRIPPFGYVRIILVFTVSPVLLLRGAATETISLRAHCEVYKGYALRGCRLIENGLADTFAGIAREFHRIPGLAVSAYSKRQFSACERLGDLWRRQLWPLPRLAKTWRGTLPTVPIRRRRWSSLYWVQIYRIRRCSSLLRLCEFPLP